MEGREGEGREGKGSGGIGREGREGEGREGKSTCRRRKSLEGGGREMEEGRMEE